MLAERSAVSADHVCSFDPLRHVIALVSQPIKIIPVVGMQDRKFGNAETIFHHAFSWFVGGEKWCLQVIHA